MNNFTAEGVRHEITDRLHRAEGLYLRLFQDYQAICDSRLFDSADGLKPKDDIGDCIQKAAKATIDLFNQRVTTHFSGGADVSSNVDLCMKPDSGLRHNGTIEYHRVRKMEAALSIGDFDAVREHTDWFLSRIDAEKIADDLNYQIDTLMDAGKQHSIAAVLSALCLNPNSHHNNIKIMKNRYCSESYPVHHCHSYDRAREYHAAHKALRVILQESDIPNQYVLSSFGEELWHIPYDKGVERGSRNKDGALDIVVFKSKIENRLSFELVQAICAYVFLEGNDDQVLIAQSMLDIIEGRKAA